MLKTLRENPAIKKIVLWLVVAGMVSGIGIGVTAVYESLVTGRPAGSDAGPWAVRVGGETITPLMVQNEIRGVAREYSSRGQGDLPDFEKRVQYDAMSRLVRRTLELQQARESGLGVTDREVSDRIITMPELQKDGRFIGTEQYKAALARNDIDVTAFESQIREGLLIQKWESLVGGGVLVTDREVEEEFARRHEKARFDYVVADAAKFSPTTLPSESEIKSHYDAHPERYQRSEGRLARYVLIDEKAVVGQVPAPTDEELRSAYDADRAKYPSSFEQAREDVRHQLTFQRSQAEIDRRAAEFRSTVSGPDALDTAASKAALRVEDTGFVRRDPDGLSMLGPEFIEALFRAGQGTLEGPVRMLRGSAVFVLTETQPPHRASIVEARVELLADVNKEKARETALAAARRSVALADGDLARVAKSLGSSVKAGKELGRDEPIPDLGYEPAVVEAAFATASGKIADPVSTQGGSVIILKVLEKIQGDPTQLATERVSIQGELRRTRESLFVNSILDAAMKRTEVKSNEEFFKRFGS